MFPIVFAVTLTRVDSEFAGRAYAAYGGIYIAVSLVWLWAAAGQRPTITDLFGATVAVSGPPIIIGLASRAGPLECCRSQPAAQILAS